MAQTACRFKVKKYLFFFLPSNILGLLCRIEVINILIILPSIKNFLIILGLLFRFEEINIFYYSTTLDFFAVPEWNKRLWFISNIFTLGNFFVIFALVGLKSWWRPWVLLSNIRNIWNIDIGKKEEDITKSNTLRLLWQFKVKFISPDKYDKEG